ncbi:hypothetical protein GWI33_007554 [Rhynchophorus ferrugineus]|uniref:Uncharacterized protein n=1 Tax=Rhynchophorus ferrugineus TaxID=354439 RepID=A0A834IE65_RHYFE|nr:hypothetical protein GWI33_007554 [Rhynchophorus ferrugineus]
MSDPTIQTFCCHHGNGTNVALTIMRELNTDLYNSVCLFSSSLGILGAIYQILPRRQFTTSHRWFSFPAERGRRIIVWLAVADLLAALGVFFRSVMWITNKNIMPSSNDDSSVLFCSISSALIQYFYIATCIWTLVYAIDMRLILRQLEYKIRNYHMVAWIVPAFLTAIGLGLLYYPKADCHASLTTDIVLFRFLPNYAATYLPLLIVMITNPILYHDSVGDMKKIITSVSGQLTSRERHIVEAIHIKFCIIILVFYLCWIPNLINGILVWTLWVEFPRDVIIIIWYIMALTNPLQAFLNAIVYRRWNAGSERIILPWKHYDDLEYNPRLPASPKLSKGSSKDERYPLLPGGPVKSINGYQSLP